MKRLLVVLLLLWACVTQMRGQEERAIPKDSLPDLWVVTIDMSGSMLDAKVKQNLNGVPDKISLLISKYGNKNKDDFVLLKSGAIKSVLLGENRNNTDCSEIVLIDHLIRTDSEILDFVKLHRKIQHICNDRAGFEYDMSFTSLIRPLSIYALKNNYKLDFSKYRRVFHVLVTDDGDINDQWLQDYKWMKKWAYKHFSCYNGILPAVASSEFDFTARKTGKFDGIETLDEVQPHIYLTQYCTYQEGNPEVDLMADSLVLVRVFQDQQLTFTMRSGNNGVSFVHIDSCWVNSHGIGVNQYLYPGESIVVAYDKTFAKTFQNKIVVEGCYQEKYLDRILGLRYRKVPFGGELSETFVSTETRTVERKCLWMILGLLMAFLLFIFIRRNFVVLRIYVNGKCISVKWKAMRKLKYNNFTLLTVVCNDEGLANTLFYKAKGIIVVDDNRTKPEENRIHIKSFRSLSPDSKNMLLEKSLSGKDITIEFDSKNIGEFVSFQYADRLSHNLIVGFETERRLVRNTTNLLRQRNTQMLACYYEQHADQISTLRNNVMVNIIRNATLGENYKDDYAVLNIFDLNSQNASNRIFLRYSMMCFFDRNTMTEDDATYKMVNLARYVLKSECQHLGYFDSKAFTQDKKLKSGVEVDVSPMLSYLYLLKKGGSCMVYSPFRDGKQGLTCKTVRVFQKTNMALLNLPVKHKHPEYKKEGPTKIKLGKSVHVMENILFLGNDKVKFMDNEKDWAYGTPDSYEGGVTYYSWNIDYELLN